MFQTCDDNEFVWEIAQNSQKMRFEKDDPIYQFGEAAEDFYMIVKGKVRLYAQNSFPFITYAEGDCVGDSDCLLGFTRDSKATAIEESILFVVKMSHV